LSTGRLLQTRPILKNISFSLADGDRVALIGPNGAGKSTLLQTLGEVLIPSKGALSIDGKVSALFNLSLGLRRQSSGRRNIIIRNLLERKPIREITQNLNEMIEFADIGEAIDRPMETYSQGMAMRVVFSAATTFRPEILLMDEWLGVGDRDFREKSNARMQELIDRSGLIVLATHHERMSKRICDKGIYLRDGEIRFFGAIDKAWDTYKRDGIQRARIGLSAKSP
jgi:lipopolysaccharide transport system ATP-binding protein